MSYDLPATRRTRRMTGDIIKKLRQAEGSAPGENGPAVAYLNSTPEIKKWVVDGTFMGVSEDIISLIVLCARTKATADYASSCAESELALAARYQRELLIRLWETLTIASITYASQCRSIIAPLFAQSSAHSRLRMKHHANLRQNHRAAYFASRSRTSLPLLDPMLPGRISKDGPLQWFSV